MLKIFRQQSNLPWRQQKGVLASIAVFFLLLLASITTILTIRLSTSAPSAHAATCGPTTNFITTWKTDNPGDSNNSSIIISGNGGDFNYQVDWNNDGVMDETITTSSHTHDFGTPGTYTIQICGEFPSIQFAFNGDRTKIIRVDQWGNNKWQSFETAFYGTVNLNITATDTPDLSEVHSLYGTFAYASSLVGNASFNNWDVSNVTNLSSTFLGATLFNQPLNNWDVSNVDQMVGTFGRASSFNQPLDNWDVSNVMSMDSTFDGATSFNQPLNNWDVSNVRNMMGMFSGASSFNQPLDNWDVSNVTEMAYMFSGVRYYQPDLTQTQKITVESRPMSFNQDLSSWDISSVKDGLNGLMGMFLTDGARLFSLLSASPVYEVTFIGDSYVHPYSYSLASWDIRGISNMTLMLSGASLSPKAYEETLASWSAQNPNSNVVLGAHGLKYCDNTARQNLVANYSWTIDGDSADCFFLAPQSSLTATDTTTNTPLPAAYDSSQHTALLKLNSKPLAEVTFVYNSLTDWSGVHGAIDESNYKSVIAGLTGAPNISGTHSLYVLKAPYHTGVVVCPQATTLTAVTESCPGGYTLTSDSPNLSIVTIDGKEYWKIDGLTGTGAMGIITNIPGAPNTGIARQNSITHLASIAFAISVAILTVLAAIKSVRLITTGIR